MKKKTINPTPAHSFITHLLVLAFFLHAPVPGFTSIHRPQLSSKKIIIARHSYSYWCGEVKVRIQNIKIFVIQMLKKKKKSEEKKTEKDFDIYYFGKLLIPEWAAIFRQPDSSFLNALVWQPWLYLVIQTLNCSFQWESSWHDKTDFRLIHVISKYQDIYLAGRVVKAVKWSPWGGAETFWLHAQAAEQTQGEQAAVNSSSLSGQGTEQMIPDMFSSSLLLALGFANQVHCHATATGAALKSDWRRSSSCRRSMRLQGKNYCANHLGLHKEWGTHASPWECIQSILSQQLELNFLPYNPLGTGSLWDFFFHCLSSSSIKNCVFGSRASRSSCKMIFISSSQTICSYPQHSKALKET